MRKSRFSDAQIMGILRQAEGGIRGRPLQESEGLRCAPLAIEDTASRNPIAPRITKGDLAEVKRAPVFAQSGRSSETLVPYP